jgi:anti-sigma regulatory factor (Ser/Thr protein kinase)
LPHESAIYQSDPVIPRSARDLAVSALAKWGLLTVRNDVELVISELVTNALGQGTLIVVLIVCHPGTEEIEVAVWDNGPGLPQAQQPDLDAESGRGLLIVEACSTSWGYRRGRDGVGKVIWARLGPKPREDHDATS